MVAWRFQLGDTSQRNCWRRLVACFALLASTGIAPGAISAEPWFATEVRGTVLTLESSQWLELPLGDPIGLGVPVRTLQSGRVQLTSGGIKLELAPGTALQIDRAVGSTTVVTQFAGTVIITANLGEGSHLVLETPLMSVTVTSGYSALRVDGDAGTVDVDTGVVTLRDLETGAQKEVAAGEATSVAELVTSTVASSNAAVLVGNEPGDTGHNPNVAGNGTGNGGGNGSGAGGNAGGSGNAGGGGGAGGSGSPGGNGSTGGNNSTGANGKGNGNGQKN